MRIVGWLQRHDRLMLVADACVFSAAAFGLILGTSALAMGLHFENAPDWLSAVVGFASLATIAVGPTVAWLLRQRRVTWAAVIGAVLGGGLVGVVIPALAIIGTALGWLLSPFTQAELAGPIAMLVLVGIAFVLVIVACLAVAIADLRAGHRTPLDLVRLSAVAILAVVAVGSWLFAIGSTDPERGELLIFVMAWGLGGGALALGADLAQTWWNRRSVR